MSCLLLDEDAPKFRGDFNKRAFAFGHSAGDHPLFHLGRLAELAARMIEQGQQRQFTAFDASGSNAATKFSALPARERVAAAIAGLEHSGSWLKFTKTEEVDEDYAAFLAATVDEIEAACGRSIRREITWSSLSVFLASPHVVTPYHIDHETNFLLQISGRKKIWLFDPTDRTVLTEDEIERFYIGNLEAARYRTEVQSKGACFDLAPGVAVHHPPLAPHWVENGESVSISVSVGFCLHPQDRRARIYQANRCMRLLGFNPIPPDQSSFHDRLKMIGMGMISKAFPRTREEILFSGIDRLRAPWYFAKGLMGGDRA